MIKDKINEFKSIVDNDVEKIEATSKFTRNQVGYVSGMLVMFYLGIVFTLLINAFIYDPSNFLKLILLCFSVAIGLIILIISTRMLLDNKRGNEIVFNKNDFIKEKGMN